MTASAKPTRQWPRPSRSALSCAWLAGAVGLAGCQAVDTDPFNRERLFPDPKPAEALWPNAGLPEVERWDPAAVFENNFDDFAGQVGVSRETADGRAATVFENPNPDRAITVYYLDISGSYQAVEVAPGARVPLAATPREILGVE